MRKYSLLVCDDEIMIRRQICGCADEMGMFDVYSAESADSAIEVLESSVIDGMILDVRMPNKNGIELLQELKSLESEPVIYMLSGHDEPEYIRKSLHYGVAEYLLKPLTGDEIRQALSNLAEHIENRRKYQAVLDRYKKQINNILPILKNQFMKDVLQCNLTRESIEETENHLGSRIIYPYMTVAVADITCAPGKDGNNPLISYAIGEMITVGKSDSIHASVFHFDNKNTVIIFGSENGESMQNLSEYLENTLIGAVQGGNTVIRIGIGGVVTEYNDLRESYSQAVKSLETADTKHGLAIVDISSITEDQSVQWSREIHLLIRKIRDINDLTDNMTFSSELREIFETVKNNSLNINELTYCCSLIVIEAINRMDSNLGILSKNPLLLLNSKSLPEEILRTTGEILSELDARLTEGTRQRKKKQADICKRIIERDYSKKIGVPEIAEEMKISSSYLSTIFKSETGYSINEYLTAYRLQLAKKLLRDTDLKMYEISERIGIPDMYYFSSVFKKNIGVSPSEYRNNH